MNNFIFIFCISTQFFPVVLYSASVSLQVQIALNNKLHQAAMDDAKNQAKKALEQGAQIQSVDDYGWNPFHKAATWRHVRIVEYLFHKKINLNAQDSFGNTAAHLAVGEPNHPRPENILPILKFLIKKGIDLTISNNQGWTALDEAQHNTACSPAVIGLLSIATAEQKHQRDVDDDLRRAAILDLPEVATVALQNRARINSPDPILHYTPLLTAVHWMKPGMVKYLIDAKADINARDFLGKTALHLVAEKTLRLHPKELRIQVLNALIPAKPDISLEDNYGWTALKSAQFAQSLGDDNHDLIEILQKLRIAKSQRDLLS